METMMPLYAIGELADLFQVSTRRIDYFIRTRRLREVRRAGIARLFDQSVVDALAVELNMPAALVVGDSASVQMTPSLPSVVA